jgi:ribonuclease Z
MKITMLGTGAALPDPDRGQSAILLTLDDDTHYLFDCGEGATRQMVRANVDPAKVGFVFLTHLHHDHICDYPYFVISSWMLNKTGAPLVLGPKGTRHFVDHLFENGAYHTDYQARSAYPVRQANLEAMRPEVRAGCAFRSIGWSTFRATSANASACGWRPKARLSRSAATPRPVKPWCAWRRTQTC